MWKNKLKTVILLAFLSGLFMLIGSLVGGAQGMTFAFIMALVMNGIMYFFSDKIVLRMYSAQPLAQEKYPALYSTVEELSASMEIPMPKLWIINTPMANAFATGRNPQNASVAVTTGILAILDHDELRGVLAHELSHVKNRDILVSTVAATMATAIGYIANMVQHMFWMRSFSGNRKQEGGNIIGMLIVAILMPIAATILQLAISRSREYLADESGAHACHDPLALASALQKLHNHVPHAHMDAGDTKHASTASLFIVNPFLGTGISELFSTHPPLNKRIERLHHIHEKGSLYVND